jgi:TonB family protein
MGSLSGCILENDPEKQERARWLRGKAFAVSLSLEAGLLAAILILPLVNPGVLGGRLIVTPLPPLGRGTVHSERARRAAVDAPSKGEPVRSCVFCPQAAAPVRPQTSGNGAEANANDAPGVGESSDPYGTGSGPLIPGADPNKGMPIEIKEPEMPRHVAPQHRSEGVMEAALIHKVRPFYPTPARLAHISGTVSLRAIIGRDGRIRELEVLNGSGFLQASAVAAVREWRYRPTLLNGVAIEVETLITVNFVLDQP